MFSAIVGSFIIETYKTLLPAGSNNQLVTNGSRSQAVRINVVLFLSFFLSIISVVSCAFVQQWCYEYLKLAYPRVGAAPHERGRVRTYLFQGFAQFQVWKFMHGAHALLHISVFLFFWAISDFFYTVNHHFGVVARYTLLATLIIYVLLSVSPLIFHNSPYNTPMTPPLRAGFIILRIIIRLPLWFPRWYRRKPFDLTGLRYYKGIHFDRVQLHMIEGEAQAGNLEPSGLGWLFTENDFSNDDMDKFLESLPGYMSSSHTRMDNLDRYLTAEPILRRIKEHFMTCATSVELSDEARIARVSSCVKALLRIFQYSRECKRKSPGRLKEELEQQQNYNQGLMDHFNTLCDMEDQTIGLYASCIRALAIQGILSQLAQDSRKIDTSRFPVSLTPFYRFFLPYNNTDTIWHGHTPFTPPRPEEMWGSLLHDGPLTNLITLAQAVRDRERAPPSTLSFCWKALDMLLTQLGTIHSGEPTPARHHFNELHEGIRTYVRSEERGFRVTPLLDILDTVARKLRLSMVFSGHPKYHSRANVVFGKEYLRNRDLLEAFAHCLPGFILKNSPEVCRDFMEKVVRYDDLWTSLQLNLWNTQKSDSPTPDKHRVFEDCCTVVDLAFSVLEDSREVDWRAPEFGSLSQHWESFIAHCFQGAFMGSATSFRVGVIRARFCKALIAQFSDDIKKEGTVSFRSQWDVASLARLICTLGLQDKENTEFWNSYVNGGDIGTVFTAKAIEMIDITARDGHLLIFCLLGDLTASAVPLDQSGLESEDIEKVQVLQRKVIDKERLRLNRPSDEVWGKVGQMRKQVKEFLGRIARKDREILQELLQMIDDVLDLRFSGSEGTSQGDPAEEQGRKTSVSVNLPSSSELRGASIQRSFASESTAVSGGGPSRGTPISEGEVGFGCAKSLLILRASIDLQPDHSTDKVLDSERETYVRSDSPQRDELGSLPSPHATVPGTTGVGIMDRPTVTSSSAVYFPYIGDARQRRSTTRRWTDSGFSGTRPSPVTRASTNVLSTSRRDSPTVLPKNPNPTIGSSYELFDLSDKGQLSAGSSSPLNRPCF